MLARGHHLALKVTEVSSVEHADVPQNKESDVGSRPVHTPGAPLHHVGDVVLAGLGE